MTLSDDLVTLHPLPHSILFSPPHFLRDGYLTRASKFQVDDSPGAPLSSANLKNKIHSVYPCTSSFHSTNYEWI